MGHSAIIRLPPKQDRPRSDPNVYWHFLIVLLFISRGNLLTRPQGIELIGELADGGRPHQGCGPLLSLAPVRQRRLDRGLARGREIGDALALVDVSTLDLQCPEGISGVRFADRIEAVTPPLGVVRHQNLAIHRP